MGSILDDKYIGTFVSTRVAWYSLCIRWSRDGSIVRIVGGDKIGLLGWVCGRGLYGCVFGKSVFLVYFDGIFLWKVNGCELRLSDVISLGSFE